MKSTKKKAESPIATFTKARKAYLITAPILLTVVLFITYLMFNSNFTGQLLPTVLIILMYSDVSVCFGIGIGFWFALKKTKELEHNEG